MFPRPNDVSCWWSSSERGDAHTSKTQRGHWVDTIQDQQLAYLGLTISSGLGLFIIKCQSLPLQEMTFSMVSTTASNMPRWRRSSMRARRRNELKVLLMIARVPSEIVCGPSAGLLCLASEAKTRWIALRKPMKHGLRLMRV